MWLLRNDEKGLIYRVTSGKQHIISRKEGDLLLLGDQSISRKHAQIAVENENESEGIILKDLGSKYGTFVVIGDGELTQLSPTQEVTLRNDDTVKFGIQWNCWRVEFVPLLVATSTLTHDEKTEVKKLVTALGGRVIGDWQDKCTHLTMNKLTVTVKVVCALASAQPIVTPAYWKSLTQCLSSMQATLPDCKDYLPPLAEAVLNPSEVSFAPNSGRCKLFNGSTFVAATSKQLSRIKPMITAAGGHVVEYSSNTCSEDKFMKNNFIFMQHSASDRQGSQQSQIPDGYIPLARKLRSKGIRCIPESEIGLSVLYCSMIQYCNPRFSAQSLLGSSSLEATQPVAVVCPNSEELNSSVDTIPVLSNSKKRSLGDINDDEEQAPKKPDLRVGSEDMFGSQHLNNTKSSGKVSLSLKKSILSNGLGNTLREKNPVERVNIDPGPSLDMFAPSGVKSNGKKPISSNGVINPPKEKNPFERVNIDPGPSLDMFAPSGIKSKGSQMVHKEAETKPSCEDMFGSTGSRHKNHNKDVNDKFSLILNKPQEKLMNGREEFSFTSNKSDKKAQKRMAAIDDEFSFVSIKKPNKHPGVMEDDVFSFTSNNKVNNKNIADVVDEFSFVSSKKPNQGGLEDDVFSFTSKKKINNTKIADVVDEFSFTSTNKSNNENIVDEIDEFSFVSTKRPNKRNRPSNPDMFASSDESHIDYSNPVAGPSKIRKTEIQNDFSFMSKNINSIEDDPFAFPRDKQKNKRMNMTFNETSPNDTVKIALFSKEDEAIPGPSGLQNSQKIDKVEDPPEEIKLITYSKLMPMPEKNKKNIENEEMDELAKELHHTTIVVVKPLVVARQIPVDQPTAATGKNFKKFRKVVGINKRVVPHIIGGSDLVPHYQLRQAPGDLLPFSPQQPPPPLIQTEDDDDEWSFSPKKRKGIYR